MVESPSLHGTPDLGIDALGPYTPTPAQHENQVTDPEDSMTANLTVTTVLPPQGRDEAVLRVAARYEPNLLRIVASVPMPDFRRPYAIHRLLLRRDRTLQRLAAAAALARTMVGPQARIETDLVRGSLSEYLASGADAATVLVIQAKSSFSVPERRTHDGRVVVAVAERETVKSR